MDTRFRGPLLFQMWFCVLTAACSLALSAIALGQAPAEAGKQVQHIQFGQDAYRLTVPATWNREEPKSRIIEHEFSLPAAEGDTAGVRVTMMSAGGSIQANIDRWIGQFSQPDGTATRDRAQVSEQAMAGQTVHKVDVAGTFQDQPGGPFGPKVDRPGYRMLAAIIATQKGGNYFIKFYGPAKSVAESEASFESLLSSLQTVD